MQDAHKEQFVYHFCGWLQVQVSPWFFEERGATQTDLQLLLEQRALEMIWHELSVSLRTKLSQIPCIIDFPEVRKDEAAWLSQIGRAMAELRGYALYSPAAQTVLLDVYFPGVASSKTFPYNMHVARNLRNPKTRVIASMSPENWKLWALCLRIHFGSD